MKTFILALLGALFVAGVAVAGSLLFVREIIYPAVRLVTE